MKYTKLYLIGFKRLLCILIVLSMLMPAYSQVKGCRDPMASNYNPAATLNDGSCTYNTTAYTPPVKADPISPVLAESSGLQMAGDFLWSLNDGGNAAALYRIDTLSSALLQTVNLENATNTDWEDLAFDGVYFYIGDFGNNEDGARTDLKIYKFPFQAIPADYNANPVVTIPAGQIKVISFTYGGQPQPPVPSSSNHTKFDCEAMLVDNGQIHLFTKNWLELNTVHYLINSVAGGQYTATPVDTLATNYLVTAADKAPGQNIIALLGYESVLPSNHYLHLLSDYSEGKYFNGNKRLINLPNASVMGQAEGLAFRDSLYGYISNERLVIINQRLRYFNIADFIPLYVLPVNLTAFTASASGEMDKIAWTFEHPVQSLKVEHSSNGRDFTVLKSYNSSQKDAFFNRQISPVNYYRLSWKESNGAIQYSNIITIKNGGPAGIGNLRLQANGQLAFTLNGSQAQNYSFRLVNADGRMLGSAKDRSYPPGRHRIYISQRPLVNSFVYLIALNKERRITTLLRVER